jgi:hypothetical protein
MSPSKVLEVMVVVGALLASSYGWGQSFPDTGPKLAPKFESKNPTSSESLAAESQNLTSNINKATSQGIDTSAAKAERAEGEKAMQQGNEREALRHFQAGEQSLRLK